MDLPYIDKTDESIKEEMLERINTDVRKQAGTFINDNLSPVSIEMAEIYIELGLLAEKMFLDNLTGEELDLKIAERTNEIQRRKATSAKGYVIVRGKPGIVIEKGTIFTNDITQYQVLDNYRIDESGLIKIDIECIEKGIIGNSDINTVTKLTEAIPGVEEIYNPEEIVGGYDEEDDDTFRKRYYEYLQNPATSGNIYHYKQWAKAVPGVGDAKVVPLWKGKNTVKVVIVDDKLKPANKELVKRVQDYIDPGSKGLGQGTAPIGAHCTIVSAKEKNISVEVKVSIESNKELSELKNEIIDNIEKYFREVSFKSDFISYAKIGASILYTPGILDYEDLKVNGSLDNIYLGDEEAPVLKDVIINEI